MKKLAVLLILSLCCFTTVSGKGKISPLATNAAKLEGFPFSLEELKNIKDSDSKYILDVARGEIALKHKAFNIRLFMKFMDKRTRKKIYKGDANFIFIAEKDKTAPKAINMAMSRLCPS